MNQVNKIDKTNQINQTDRANSSRQGKINRKRNDQQGLLLCKSVCGRSWRSGVANDLALHEVDHQLGDVGGMIGHPFEVFGNEAQADSACNRASILEHE